MKLMNNEIFLRLNGLMKNLGFAMQEGGSEKAEIAGYAAAISLADRFLSNLLDNLFIDTMSQKGISMYSELLNLEKAENEDAAKQNIVSRMAGNYHQLTLDEFKSGVQLSESFSVSDIASGQIILQINSLSREAIKNIAYIIKNYFPVHIKLSADGSGLSWDEFEELNLRWYESDGYELSFGFLDSLKAGEQ